MLSFRTISFTVAYSLFAAACLHSAETVKTKIGPSSSSSSLFSSKISQAYLDGKWADLETLLENKDPAALTREQRTEIAAIRRAFAECRPPWWKAVNGGQTVAIRPALWGRTLDLVFDPKGKSGVEMKFNNNVQSLTVTWPVGDMDSAEHAEHGFSRGELNNLLIWGNLGMALVWSQTPPQALVNLTEKDKLRLSRYHEFRSNVTGLYYGTPRARRWGEFLYLLMWKDKYSEMVVRNSPKAAGAMFLVEVLGNAAKYPSVPAPQTAPSSALEEKLAEHYRNWIEKHGCTVAEDVALRTAIHAFGAANETSVLQTKL